MEPWYRVVTLRKEVREGRSFSPDEFAIALEQVVDGTAPEDYSDPNQFFSRTCFTRALTDHTGMVLRRLTGETANTSPVVTLVTQFGGGQDPHAHHAVPPSKSRRRSLKVRRSHQASENGRNFRGTLGTGRRLRRQRLGPPRWRGNPMDRPGPAARG